MIKYLCIRNRETFTSVADVTTKLLFGICDSMVDSDVGTGDFSLVLRILLECGHAYVRSHVSPGMDRYFQEQKRYLQSSQ